MKQAEVFKVKTDVLIGGTITGIVDDETFRWVAGFDDRTHGKLAAVGLAKPRTGLRASLGPFIDQFTETCTGGKEDTLENWQQVRR